MLRGSGFSRYKYEGISSAFEGNNSAKELEVIGSACSPTDEKLKPVIKGLTE